MDLTFQTPELILLLTIPLAMIFMVWLSKGHPITLPLDHSKSKHGSALAFFTNCASTLPALILALVIIILAGPQKQGLPEDEKIMNNILEPIIPCSERNSK